VSHSSVFVTTFLAACVEVIEMVIIVVGVGSVRGGGRRGLVPAPASPSWQCSSWRSGRR
jgi:uncharacterized membrane protein